VQLAVREEFTAFRKSLGDYLNDMPRGAGNLEEREFFWQVEELLVQASANSEKVRNILGHDDPT
jgi:DNA-binding ferritin-like protein (Dps family)